MFEDTLRDASVKKKGGGRGKGGSGGKAKKKKPTQRGNTHNRITQTIIPPKRQNREGEQKTKGGKRGGERGVEEEKPFTSSDFLTFAFCFGSSHLKKRKIMCVKMREL